MLTPEYQEPKRHNSHSGEVQRSLNRGMNEYKSKLRVVEIEQRRWSFCDGIKEIIETARVRLFNRNLKMFDPGFLSIQIFRT